MNSKRHINWYLLQPKLRSNTIVRGVSLKWVDILINVVLMMINAGCMMLETVPTMLWHVLVIIGHVPVIKGEIKTYVKNLRRDIELEGFRKYNQIPMYQYSLCIEQKEFDCMNSTGAEK